jgi:hypothetical protein
MKMLNRLIPTLALLVLAGAAQPSPTGTPSTPALTPTAPPRYQVYQLPDGSRVYSPRPLTPTQVQSLAALSRRPAMPPFPHGPGDVIPPCIISYGFTTRGLTDQYGHLLGTPTLLPRWTDISGHRK